MFYFIMCLAIWASVGVALQLLVLFLHFLQIEKAEQSVRTCFYKVQVIEKSLKSLYISMEER
jgi:hypothetical protein